MDTIVYQGPSPKTLDVEPGNYLVTATNNDGYYDETTPVFSVDSGEEVDVPITLTSVVNPPPPPPPPPDKPNYVLIFIVTMFGFIGVKSLTSK